MEFKQQIWAAWSSFFLDIQELHGRLERIGPWVAAKKSIPMEMDKQEKD